MEHLVGNAVVGQSGGPTAAINATLAGVIRGVREELAPIGKLYGMRNGIDGFLAERLIDLGAAVDSEEKLQLLEHTPAAALGSCRRKLPDPAKDPAVYEALLALFRKYDIRYFFYIGGNDSMDTVSRLSAYLADKDWEMRVIGVPKTIDNDLMGTDHTPGFGSAAKYIAVTMQEILRDCAVYTVPAVTVVEIMGRDAGWLTASAAAGGYVTGCFPDLIYLPERKFSTEQFLADVRAAQRKHPNVVVAVSEGIRSADGHYVGEGAQSGAVDAFGHAYLAGAGKVLEQLIKAELGCKVRSVELNLPQRCAAHLASATDLAESVGVGRAAVAAAGSGVTGEMMSIDRMGDAPYAVRFGHSAIAGIANRVRQVGDGYINAAANGMTDAFRPYILPLIQGEAATVWENGIPKHLILE